MKHTVAIFEREGSPQNNKALVNAKTTSVNKIKYSPLELSFLLTAVAVWFSYQPYFNFGFMEMSVCKIGIALFVVIGLIVLATSKTKNKTKIFRSKLIFWPLLLTVIALFGLLYTPDLLVGLRRSGMLVLAFGAFIAMLILKNTIPKNRFRQLLINWGKIFVIMGFIIGGVALLQTILDAIGIGPEWTLLPEKYRWQVFGFARATGFSREPMFLGSLLIVPALFFLWQCATKKSGSKQYFGLGFFCFVLGVMLSRGALYSLLGATIITVVVYIIKSLRQHQKITFDWQKLVKIILTVLLAISAVLSSWYALASINPNSTITGCEAVKRGSEHLLLGRFNILSCGEGLSLAESTSIIDGGNDEPFTVSESNESRKLSWDRVEIQAWRKNIWTVFFGVGSGGLGTAINKIDPTQNEGTIMQNGYIKILAEWGLIGLTVFLIINIGLLVLMAKNHQWLFFLIQSALIITWLSVFEFSHTFHIFLTMAVMACYCCLNLNSPKTKLTTWQNKWLEKAKKHKVKLLFVLGLLLVLAWTLFKFSTEPVIFDLTGQQLLARQWLDGYHAGSMLVPTNYILKIWLLYMPAELLHLDPTASLIGITIAINCITFAGIFYFLRKIYQYFHQKTDGYLEFGLLYFASIAGSIFWIQFANSRNLEVVGGLAIIYIGLLVLQKPTIKRTLLLAIISTIVFFADPMQIYMTSFILASWALWQIIKKKISLKPLLIIIATLLIGTLFSALFTNLVCGFYNIEYGAVSSLQQSLQMLEKPITSTIWFLANNAFIFSGGWFRINNMALVLCVAVAFALMLMVVIRAFKSKRQELFAVIAVVCVEGIYFASGQAGYIGNNTSRYLIMMMPFVVWLIGESARNSHLIKVLMVIVIGANSLLLTQGLIENNVGNFTNESQLHSRISFLQEQSYDYGFASKDTAITSDYLFGKDKPNLLPLECFGENLRTNWQFFDKAVFLEVVEKSTAEYTPIIFDGNTITNTPSICSIESIEKQFGAPITQTKTTVGDKVLIYQTKQVLEKLVF